MTIKIPFSELPEAKNWEDGMSYQLEVTQVGSDATGVTLELTPAEEEEDSEPDSYSRMSEE